MDPKEALAIIDNVLAQVAMNRQQQAHIQRCVATISKALEPENERCNDDSVTTD